MGRNFGAQFRYRWFLLILCFLVAEIVAGFKIEIPNYEILKNQKILTQNFQFPHVDNSLEQMKEQYRQEVMHLLNQKNKHKYTVLRYELFIYPYRVYSYFDHYNKKQYLMKRVNFTQFRSLAQQPRQNQTISQHKSLLESEINIEEWPLKQTQGGLPEALFNEKMGQIQSQPQSEMFSESELFSIIPDLLTIDQDQHQMLELQKMNDEHMLIKVYANPESKYEYSQFLQLHLHRVNIHSFIYEARLTLMRLLKIKTQQSANLIRNEVTKDTENGQVKEESNQKSEAQQSKEGQAIEAQKQSSVKNIIKMKDYFESEREVWSSLQEQNSAILSNLFTCETVFNIKKDTKYDYLASKATFYLAEVNYLKCPLSTHDITFKLFAQKVSTGDQVQTQSGLCTYLTIHKAHFIQADLPQPIEYVSEQSLFHNINMISLGFVKTNESKRSARQSDLLIQMLTDKNSIEIVYGKAWKEIRAEQRLANLTKNQQGQYPLSKVFFLSETKLSVQNDTITLYRQASNNIGFKFEPKCSFKVEPFILTVQKIHNQLFSYCAEGSYCTLVDQECKKISEVSLTNALGVKWKYKLNYQKDKILSYVTLSRRSDLMYLMIPVPVGIDQMQIPALLTGTFHHRFNFEETEPGLYQVNQTVVRSIVQYEETTNTFEILPAFQLATLPCNYQPEQLFLDSTYQSFAKFKENYLDYILLGKIEEKFDKFYFPDFPKSYSENPVKLLNIMNRTEFKSFFNDCVYDSEKEFITFKKNWKGCKIVLKTNSLLLSESTNVPPDNVAINFGDMNQKIETRVDQPYDVYRSHMDKSEKAVEIFSNNGTGKNLLIVCSAPRSSAGYSKCRVTAIDITQGFRDWNRNAKFFLDGGKYFQLYFFNQKFLTESSSDSLLQLLEKLAMEQFPKQDYKDSLTIDQLPNQIQNNASAQSPNAHQSQLKSYKIHYTKLTSTETIFISLIDYQKQQLQGILKILLIAVCILFPVLTIFCCVVCFKSNFQNILIYYGVMNVQPSFRYPLNSLALKIKMRQLTENSYVKIHKNAMAHTIGDELSSNSDIKYSVECCFCLEELQIEEEVAELYCKHEFHSKCFIEWVQNEPNTKCPLCKRAFTKTALNQFKQRPSPTLSPNRPIQNFSQENQNVNSFSLEQNIVEISFDPATIQELESS